MLKNKLELINKKEYRWIFVVLSSILYMSVSTFMLVKYYESYAIDEFYALASLNPNAQNLYHRHTYINQMVVSLGRIINDNYYAGKLIPYVVGIICFTFIMALLVMICKSNAAVLLGGFAYSLNSLVIFNHIYIRHYVFAELAFIILAFGLYVFYAKKGSFIFRIIALLIGLLADYLYITKTNDDSVWGFEMFTVAVLLLMLVHNGIYFLFNRRSVRVTIIGLILVVLCGCVVFFGNNKLMQVIPPVFRVKFEQFKGDMPVFWLLAVCTFSYVVVALIAFMFADNYNKVRDLYPVWILVFLASTAYIVAFPYNYLVRTFTPYLGVGIVLAVGFWDRIIEKKNVRIVIFMVVIVSTFLSYPEFKFRWFFTGGAGVYEETYLENYCDLIADVKKARNEGYEIASMMSFKSQEYVLGIDPDYSLSEFGDNNEELLSIDDAVKEIRNLQSAGKKVAICTSNFGGQLLDQTGLLAELTDRYEYKNYNGTNQYLIYIE